MPLKKKIRGKVKGKQKAEKKDPNKLNQVDRTFYELTITDLNQKLARLRAHLASLDDTNVNMTDKLKEMTADSTDVTAHLERTLTERNNNVKELEERLTEITKVRNKENLLAQNNIRDLEAKYKGMHDQLTSEIKLLNGKLNSLEEFRIQRDGLLAKFDEQEFDMKEKERSYKEELYTLERKTVVEKDALKKEVESKLLQVAEDFMRSSEIRSAGYSRRLIRENVALQKEIDNLMASQLQVQSLYKNKLEEYHEMKDRYSIMEHIKDELIRNSNNKLKIILELTALYEKLKEKYVDAIRNRRQYEYGLKEDACERIKYKQVEENVLKLTKTIEGLKTERSKMIALLQQHEIEIGRLHSIIGQIRVSVRTVILKQKNKSDEEDLQQSVKDTNVIHEAKRNDLLIELLNIISTHAEGLPMTPSIQSISADCSLYRSGKIGLLKHKKSSLLEMFRTDANKVYSIDTMPSYHAKRDASIIVPRPRLDDGQSLIDVEWGSTLYVTSSRDNEDVEVEAEPLEYGEGSSSSISSAKVVSDHLINVTVQSNEKNELASSTRESSQITAVSKIFIASENEEASEEDEFEINLFY